MLKTLWPSPSNCPSRRCPVANPFRYINAALAIHSMNPIDKLVLLVLAIRTNPLSGTCHPSYTTLAEDTGLHTDTIRVSIHRLRDADMVAWKPGHGNQYTKRRANLYTLNLPKLLARNSKSADTESGFAD